MVSSLESVSYVVMRNLRRSTYLKFDIDTFTIRAISQDEFEDVQPPPLANKLENSGTSNDKNTT